MNYSPRDFYSALFECFYSEHEGFIEHRVFSDGNGPKQHFHNNIANAAKANLSDQTYFGVCPRKSRGGRKEDVAYAVTLWADVDYGEKGHKKASPYSTEKQARDAISKLKHKPSIIVNSGGGFHCYWLLKQPVGVESEQERVTVENTNKGIEKALQADTTHDISRVLRAPGSPTKPEHGPDRKCEIAFFDPDLRYSLSDFKGYLDESHIQANKNKQGSNFSQPDTNVDIADFKLVKKFQDLVLKGDLNGYQSRSERDHAVVCALVKADASDDQIRGLFQRYAVGDKYREKGRDGDQYLDLSLSKARLNMKDSNSGKSDQRRFDPTPYIQKLLESHTFVFEPNVGFYIWTDERYFQRVNDEHILSLINLGLGNQSYSYCRKEVFERLKLEPNVILPIGTSLNQKKHLLNLKNGMYDINTFNLIPHDRKHLSTIPLDVEFNEHAKCPLWDKFIDEIFDNDEDRRILQEIFGYCLTAETCAEKAFFLFGEGSNGKSVACEVLIALIGRDNVSSVQLCDLGRDFHTISLRNKLLNLATDVDARDLTNSGLFKTIISGEMVEDSYKNKNRFPFRPYAKLIFSMNNKPRISDKSIGLYRRLVILPFPKHFAENQQDKGLKSKLKSEINGIFNWSLIGLDRLRQHDFQFTKSDSTKGQLEEYKRQNNPLLCFLDDKCDLSNPEAQTEKDHLYTEYRDWAQLSGHRPTSQETFFRDFKRETPHCCEKRIRVGNGKRVRIIEGIELLE